MSTIYRCNICGKESPHLGTKVFFDVMWWECDEHPERPMAYFLWPPANPQDPQAAEAKRQCEERMKHDPALKEIMEKAWGIDRTTERARENKADAVPPADGTGESPSDSVGPRADSLLGRGPSNNPTALSTTPIPSDKELLDWLDGPSGSFTDVQRVIREARGKVTTYREAIAIARRRDLGRD